MVPERMSKAEQARRLAAGGWTNAEIAAIVGLRARSIRDVIRQGIRAGLIQPNGERRGAGAMAPRSISAPGALP